MKNQERLKELLLAIKGERTIRKWAEDAGVSPSTLSNYINDKVRGTITPQTLRKLVDPESHPRGDVSYEELLAAGGFDELKFSDAMIDMMLTQSVGASQEATSAIHKRQKSNARMMKMLVASEAAISSGMYKVIQDDGELGSSSCVTLAVSNGSNIHKWIVVIDPVETPFVHLSMCDLKLGRILHIIPEEGLKVTLFTCDKLFYEHYCYNKATLAYEFDFSLIYFDRDSVSGSKDLYLTHHDECGDEFDLFARESIVLTQLNNSMHRQAGYPDLYDLMWQNSSKTENNAYEWTVTISDLKKLMNIPEDMPAGHVVDAIKHMVTELLGFTLRVTVGDAHAGIRPFLSITLSQNENDLTLKYVLNPDINWADEDDK